LLEYTNLACLFFCGEYTDLSCLGNEKWLSPREQLWAPSGTHFHQFVVPVVIHFRLDCTYIKLAAMCLRADVQSLDTCE
jgi:hypothetical protein